MNNEKDSKEKVVKTGKGKGVDTQQKKLADLQKKYDEIYDSLLRATAEIENTKKRSQKEIENAYKFSNEAIIEELIPIYESLDLSINLTKKPASPEKLKEGNEMLLSMFKKLFESNSVKEINPLNEIFNPEFHQAISTKSDKNFKNNQILEVVQKGYQLNDRVIKPALVIVVKNP